MCVCFYSNYSNYYWRWVVAVRCATYWVMQWKHSKMREQLCGVDLDLPWVKQLAVWRSWSADTDRHTRSPRSVTASKFASNKPCTMKCFWTIRTCSYTRILSYIAQPTILIIVLKFYGDRGGTVFKVLCYKSEGRWFDSRWCHWNFSFT